MRLGRVAAITASIALVGAVIGALVGAALLAAWAVGSGVMGLDVRDGALFGAAAGGGLGAILAPITAWVFLRRVPLGRALAHTAVGTTAGAAAGLVLGGLGVSRVAYGSLPIGLAGALVGFLAAALRLRFASRGATGRSGSSTRADSAH